VGFVEDLDAELTQRGFTKVLDATPEILQRDKTESCLETYSTGSCSSYRSGEVVVIDTGGMIVGAIAVYISWSTVADWQPRDAGASCSIEVEIDGEGDNYTVQIAKWSYDKCPIYYA